MLEFARNEPVEMEVLAGLFARCGWTDKQADLKLAWAIAASEEWIVCKLDGEVIGFGRSCRLGPVKRVVFDLMVDPRFDHPLLRRRIVRMLAESAGDLEEVSVFRQRSSTWSMSGRPLTPGMEEGDLSAWAEALESAGEDDEVAVSGAAEESATADEPARAGEPGRADSSRNVEVYIGDMLRFRYPPAPPGAYLGGVAVLKEER